MFVFIVENFIVECAFYQVGRNRKMELYQLNCALMVAKYKNFSHAANEIAVTTSSLSQQIKKLEEELGIDLFVRTTRSVHLTPAGEEFIGHAKKVMNDMENINASMQKYIIGENGHLSIGSLPAFKAFGIANLVASFQKQYPKIVLSIQEAECFDLYPLLFHGEIDVAFLTAFDKYHPDKLPLEAYPLFEDEIVMIANRAHPFASREYINLKEAANEKFIAFSKQSGLYLDELDACHAAGFNPNFVYSSQYVDTSLGFVAEGLGVTMLSSRTVLNTVWKNIEIIRIRPRITRTVSLVYLKKNRNSSVIANFVDFSRKNFLHNPI
jgi:LysR family transcriptional regulator, transcription activator of glutamate synthase operon